MIAVNLVTGFLGTGKTTLVRHLLAHHPENETWAVLVNEFGEVGIDGALLDETGVAIEEVAGGCLCCVAAPAFEVGLNRLIRAHRPERILIEPSGLGHPAQILERLRSPLYREVLHLEATLCLVDPRHLDSPRHLAHPVFRDQIHLADVLIANKADLCDTQQQQAFLDFAAELQPPPARLAITEQGRIDPQLLCLDASPRTASFPEAHAFLLADEAAPEPVSDARRWQRYEGEADGFHRLGWHIGPDWRFERRALLDWLNALPCERIKGVLHTTEGLLEYNRAGADAAAVRDGKTDEQTASRLQLIDPAPLEAEALETALRRCLLS